MPPKALWGSASSAFVKASPSVAPTAAPEALACLMMATTSRPGTSPSSS